MGGSSPTSTPVQVAPPQYPPGYAFSESFFDQVLPQLLNTPYPRFGGEVDPGLSPTMAALLRGGQTHASAPFSDQFNQAGATMGGLMNVNYENPMASVDPNRYGFDYGAKDFDIGGPQPPAPPSLPQSMKQAASMMGASSAGAPPAGGMGQATAYGGSGPNPRPPGSGSPGPIGEDPLENRPDNKDPWIPTGVIQIINPDGSISFVPDNGPPSPPGGLSPPTESSPPPGEPGAAPPPGGGLPNIPPWLLPILGAIPPSGGGGGGGFPGGFDPNFGKPDPIDLNFGGVQPYQPISGGQGFADYNPGSPIINMVGGLQSGGSYGTNPMPPGPIGGPPGGQPPPGGGPPGGGGQPPPDFDLGGRVPGNQLEWFGRWNGPNKGKSMDEIHQDMYERGWDYGPNFVKPEGWGERGSKATTWEEARMKNPNAAPRQGGPPPSGEDPRTVSAFSGAGAPAGGK